jgi:hypothetical protein
MGSQVSFAAIEGDERELRDHLIQIGFHVVPETIQTDSVPPLSQVSDYFLRAKGEFFYLLPAEFNAVEAFYREIGSDPSRSKLMPMSSPAIEFAFCRREGSKVFVSRVHLGTDKTDSRYARVRIKLDKIFRFIKKWPVINNPRPIYVGPYTFECLREGKIRLFDDRIELHADEIRK